MPYDSNRVCCVKIKFILHEAPGYNLSMKNNQDSKDRKRKSGTNRRYPPFWEKSVPFFIAIAGLATLILIVFAILVIFGNARS